MTFLDRILGRSDPASQWVADPSVSIELDLDKPALCGIRLGDHSDRIERLGPPDNARPSRDEKYDFSRLGLSLDAEAHSVNCFTVVFDEAAEGVVAGRFGGEIRYGGQRVALDSATTETEFRRRFGEPYWRDVDGKECLLFYEFGSIEWQVEFALTGGLRVLTVVTPPLLSDEEQRRRFRVDKPWPPASARSSIA